MANYIINPEEVVGTLIPNVYISRITLESGGFIQSRFQDNPHIDPSQSQKDAGIIEGGRTYGADSLNIITQLTVKDVTSNNLSKWFAQDQLMDSSGNPKTIKDYIKVVVIRTSTPEATQYWSSPAVYNSQDPSLLGYSNSAKIEFFLTDLEGDPNFLDRHYQEYDLAGNSVRNICKNITSNENWELTDGTGNPAPDLETNPRHLAFFVWAQFDLHAFVSEYSVGGISAPMSLIHRDTMVGKINSDIVFKNSELIKTSYLFLVAQLNPASGGSYAAETVTPTNKIWAGPFHYQDGQDSLGTAPQNQFFYTGWVAGKQFVSLSETPVLVRQTVPNTKIQDFRIAKRIDKLNLSLSNLENVVLKLVNKNPRSVIKDIKFSYFTDIQLSRDKDNNCRFFFGIDLRKMVRDNSVYSGLFSKNSGWLTQAMLNVRIVSMRIFRQRVQGSSELSDSPYYFSNTHEFNPVHKLKKFNNGLHRNTRTIREAQTVTTDVNIGLMGIVPLSSTTPALRASYDGSNELIIEALEIPEEPGPGYILVSAPGVTDGTSTIRNLGSIYTENNTGGIFYYTGVDGGMSNITDGYYQYRVELEILDDCVSFLSLQQQNLGELINDLEEYFSIASQPGINGIKELTRGDPHTTEENVYASGGQVANFDPITNRFSQNFIDGNAWSTYNFATRYVEILKVFININPAEQATIVEALNTYTDPLTGNLQGCLLVLGLLRRLMSVIERSIGIQKGTPKAAPTDSGQATNATGQTSTLFESNIEKGGSAKLKTFKMKHTFSSYYDGNFAKDTGYDFLGTGMNGMSAIPEGAGLRIVTHENFQSTIVPKEIQKIFRNPESIIELHGLAGAVPGGHIGTSLQNTDYSYLTPAIVKTPKRDILMVAEGNGGAPNIQARDFMNVWTPVQRRATISSRSSLGEQLADFFSYNYSLTAVSEPEVTLPFARPGDDNSDTILTRQDIQYQEAYDQQSLSNELAFNTFWSLLSTGGVSEGNRGGASLSEGSNQKSITFYNSQNNTNGFLTSPTDLTAATITNLPNPIKALIRYNDQIQSNTGPGPNAMGYQTALKSDIENFLASEPFLSAQRSSKARILFETIGEIQFLKGYGLTTYGQEQAKLIKSQMAERNENPSDLPPIGEPIEEPSVRRPIWITLTREEYNRAPQSYFLCRIRRWENSIFKIQKAKGSELPIYEEYFLLEGATADAPDNTRNEQLISMPTPAPPRPGVRTDYTTSNPPPQGLSTGGSGQSGGSGVGGSFTAQDAAQMAAAPAARAAAIAGVTTGGGTGGGTTGTTYTPGSNNPGGGMSQ